MICFNEMKPTHFDFLFIKNLKKVTSEEEMREILELLDMEKNESLSDREYEKIELFFIKTKKMFGSLYDSIIGIAKIYDIDIELLIKNKRIVQKLQAEKIRSKNNLDEFF